MGGISPDGGLSRRQFVRSAAAAGAAGAVSLYATPLSALGATNVSGSESVAAYTALVEALEGIPGSPIQPSGKATAVAWFSEMYKSADAGNRSHLDFLLEKTAGTRHVGAFTDLSAPERRSLLGERLSSREVGDGAEIPTFLAVQRAIGLATQPFLGPTDRFDPASLSL